MRGWRPICDAVYWLALCLWTAALISAGAAAAFVFATLPRLGVSLDRFTRFNVEGEPEAHGRIAAGMVLEKVFTASDFAQVVFGPIVALMLAIQVVVFGESWRRPANVIRALAIGLAIVTAFLHIFFQAPAMNRELRAYWAAAETGDVDGALRHRARFDASHPRAELALQSNTALLLITIAASAAAARPRPAASAGSLETPALSRERS